MFGWLFCGLEGVGAGCTPPDIDKRFADPPKERREGFSPPIEGRPADVDLTFNADEDRGPSETRRLFVLIL